MARKLRCALACTVLLGFLSALPPRAVAGPPEDADAVLMRWSATYSANDPDAVTAMYWPDAVLLGTVSPVISVGTAAIGSYFSRLRGSGNKNDIGEKHVIVVDDNAVLVTGFYRFTRMAEGRSVPAPSRFTMLITRRNGAWGIAHHHSSPHVQPR